MLKQKELEQIRQKSKAEVLKDVRNAQQELIELRMKKFRGTTTNAHLERSMRKKIAQLQSILNKKDAS